jgi:hypothetical protein
MANLTKYERWQRENPEGTPEQALAAGVIDQNKYDELRPPTPQPKIKPVVTSEAIPHAKPITRPIRSMPTQDDRVYVKYNPTGKTTLMNKRQAETIVRNSPHNYQIVTK